MFTNLSGSTPSAAERYGREVDILIRKDYCLA
jgi:hypothetical protein